jgi:signal transduction histidine kinase
MDSDGFPKKVDQLNNLIRSLMAGLRPPLLDEGLYLALEQFVEDLNTKNSATRVRIHIPSSLLRFDPSIEQHLFRIIQQACENAIIHAQAKSVSVSGEIKSDGIDLEVSDDGLGFEMHSSNLSELLKTHHFGLAGMSERAAMTGADLSIDSTPGVGTKIELHWKPKTDAK